tara:strand:- start:498 stop:653 length:156 start_codon:yes stop_codon:yes gene_type:complete
MPALARVVYVKLGASWRHPCPSPTSWVWVEGAILDAFQLSQKGLGIALEAV